MADTPDLDFERAATLMDVVQKVAAIAPAYMAISSLAMVELKEMNIEAQQYLDDLGKERLAKEQEAAARLNRQSLEEAVRTAPRAIPANAPQLRTPMPGEPVDPIIQHEANAEGGDMGGPQGAPIIRRTAAPDLNDASKQGSG